MLRVSRRPWRCSAPSTMAERKAESVRMSKRQRHELVPSFGPGPLWWRGHFRRAGGQLLCGLFRGNATTEVFVPAEARDPRPKLSYMRMIVCVKRWR